MPTIHRERSYRFRFFAADRGEPPHVHAIGKSGYAKVWLEPIKVAHAGGYNRRQIAEIMEVVRREQPRFLAGWHEFLG